MRPLGTGSRGVARTPGREASTTPAPAAYPIAGPASLASAWHGGTDPPGGIRPGRWRRQGRVPSAPLRLANLDPATRRRAILQSGATVVLCWAFVLGAFYVVPIGEEFGSCAFLRLGADVALIAAVFVWQIRRISVAESPGAACDRGARDRGGAWRSSSPTPASIWGWRGETPWTFSQRLDQTRALYFTISVFSTVGFGDITPDRHGAPRGLDPDAARPRHHRRRRRLIFNGPAAGSRRRRRRLPQRSPSRRAGTAGPFRRQPRRGAAQRSAQRSAQRTVARRGVVSVEISPCVVTAPCFHRAMELDDFAECARRTGRVGRRQLRRRGVDRAAAPATWPLRVLRHRGNGRLRGGGGVGGRRGEDGLGLARPRWRPAGAPGAGCAWPGRCVTCPRAPRPGVRRHRGRPARAIAAARRHRTEASMAHDEGLLVAQATEMGFEDFSRALPIGSSWPTLTGPTPPRRIANGPQRVLGVELHRHVARPDDPRPGLGLHRRRRAQPPGARPLRGRLRRSQGTPGRTARIDELARTSAQRRADALVEMATRSAERPGRRHPARPALQRLRRLRDPPRAHLRARERDRARPLGAQRLDGLGLLRAGHLLARQPGRRQRAGPALHRRDPPGHRAARPDLHPPLLLRARRELPGRPHRALRRGWARPPRRTGACSVGFTTACATSASASAPHRRRPEAGPAGRRTQSRPAVRETAPSATGRGEFSPPLPSHAPERAPSPVPRVHVPAERRARSTAPGPPWSRWRSN